MRETVGVVCRCVDNLDPSLSQCGTRDTFTCSSLLKTTTTQQFEADTVHVHEHHSSPTIQTQQCPSPHNKAVTYHKFKYYPYSPPFIPSLFITSTTSFSVSRAATFLLAKLPLPLLQNSRVRVRLVREREDSFFKNGFIINRTIT